MTDAKAKFCPYCGYDLVPSWDNKYLYCLKCFKYKEKANG